MSPGLNIFSSLNLFFDYLRYYFDFQFLHLFFVITSVIFFVITTIAVPAQIAIGVWFLVQLTNGLGSIGLNTGGVAWFAHIGGFAVGVATQKMFRTFRIE